MNFESKNNSKYLFKKLSDVQNINELLNVNRRLMNIIL